MSNNHYNRTNHRNRNNHCKCTHSDASFTQLLLALLLCLLVSLSQSASQGRSNYHAYQYDMTIPQFTPDGRLLQVEYASLAATHSSPCVIWRIPMVETSESTTTTTAAAADATTAATPQSHAILCMVASSPSKRKVMHRIVSLKNNMVIVLSGVLADSMALLTKVYKKQDDFQRYYGTSPHTNSAGAGLSISQIADAIASACQHHAFGGGLRPYGSTFLIIDPYTGTMLQTDPSGAIWNPTTGSSTTTTGSQNEEFLIVMGGKDVSTLRKKLLQDDTPTTIADALLVMAKHLVKDPTQDGLEIMIMTPEKGTYRLSDDQVQRLLAKLPKPKEQ